MSISSSRRKPVAEGDQGAIGPESFATGATEAIHAYLAGPLQKQARWQEKLNAPFERLFTKPKPMDADIKEAQKAYRTALSQVTKEIESVGKEIGPQPLLQGPATAEELDILFDEPLTLADIQGSGSGAMSSKIRSWESMAAHIFEPSNFHPDGRNSFTLANWGREPTTPFSGAVSSSAADGGLLLHNAINTDPSPGAPQATMTIWAGVGALLIPQIEKGWLRVRTWVSYSGTGIINLPPWQSFPINVRADNFFSIRTVIMSAPVNTNQWLREQDVSFNILSQGWTGAGGTTLGGNGIFGTRGNQELLVPFDRAGGQPRIYALWVLGEDQAICGSRPEVVNSVDIAMNCTVAFLKVDELIKRNIRFF